MTEPATNRQQSGNKPETKYVSDFDKLMRALSFRLKFVRMLWNSSVNGTYVKAKHGPLKNS